MDRRDFSVEGSAHHEQHYIDPYAPNMLVAFMWREMRAQHCASRSSGVTAMTIFCVDRVVVNSSVVGIDSGGDALRCFSAFTKGYARLHSADPDLEYRAVFVFSTMNVETLLKLQALRRPDYTVSLSRRPA